MDGWEVRNGMRECWFKEVLWLWLRGVKWLYFANRINRWMSNKWGSCVKVIIGVGGLWVGHRSYLYWSWYISSQWEVLVKLLQQVHPLIDWDNTPYDVGLLPSDWV
ncbi:hypothetical protein [Candidatus Hodgkinia cicadicola]|uniref:hypothetical protein n=1 Tax=Candidatus Hodgkinia cicadicola TaxID=573658 RepID=UPI001788C443